MRLYISEQKNRSIGQPFLQIPFQNSPTLFQKLKNDTVILPKTNYSNEPKSKQLFAIDFFIIISKYEPITGVNIIGSLQMKALCIGY